MTREEKISHLKGILSEINENDNAVCYLTSEDNELIESAIEALEQQPCEDCISREQAVDAVADLFEMSEYPHPYPQGKPIRLKDIKEKLKQLPSVQPKPIECEDAISMMDLLNNLHKHFSKGFETDEWWNSTHVLQAVKDCRPELFDLNYVPSVQPQPKTGHWIPVSERLPEESDYVSCLPFYDGVVIWLTDKGIMGFGWYYNSTNNWADTNDCWSDKYGEVIAWMPLPEPYKPQESEDKQ